MTASPSFRYFVRKFYGQIMQTPSNLDIWKIVTIISAWRKYKFYGCRIFSFLRMLCFILANENSFLKYVIGQYWGFLVTLMLAQFSCWSNGTSDCGQTFLLFSLVIATYCCREETVDGQVTSNTKAGSWSGVNI